MKPIRTARTLTAGALCALIAASAPPLTASALSPPIQHDGEPTPAACSDLGFEIGEQAERDRRTRAQADARSYRSPVTAAPAPPPPPAPPVVVSGQRMERGFSPPTSALTITGEVAPSPAPNPAARDTERYPGVESNPIKRVAEEPVSTFSIDVDTASYANVRRYLNEGRLPPRDAVRVEELINYFDYDYPAPAGRETPFRPFLAVAPSPWAPGKQIVHIALQGYELPAAEQPPLNLVFLIDTSGSMYAEDRLPLAKRALNLLIDQLRPGDRVSIVAYAGSAGAVLEPTGGRSKLKMRCAIEALSSGGSTAGGQGLALAYDLARRNFDPKAVNRVVLLTDGDFNVGVADPSRLKDYVADQRKEGIYLSVYGFGRGNYNDTMMQTLAQNGNGTAAYVDSFQEARRLFQEDLTTAMFPIADDVKIQVEFNPGAVLEYRLIGYETRMLKREDFNNDRVDAGEVGSGASVTALYEITPVGGAPSSDPLRYGREPAARRASGEIGYLKVRYKRPGESQSRLIEAPIRRAGAFGSLAEAPEQTRWAVAVAGFGQSLRGDPWLSSSFGWPDIEALASGAKGVDRFGARGEFIELTGKARKAPRL
ncbi:MAG: vWA domain-containing protein [Caulobacter sp.]